MDNKPEFDFDTYRKRLLDLRKKKGFTIEELAKRSGVKKGTINKNIRKDNPNVPSMDTLAKIAQALDVDPDYLTNAERRYPKYEKEKIAELTGLTPEAVKYIMSMSEEEKYTFSKMITNKYFPGVMSGIWWYLNSPKKEMYHRSIISNEPGGKSFHYTPSFRSLEVKQGFFKYVPTNNFSKLVDQMYSDYLTAQKDGYVITLKNQLMERILDRLDYFAELNLEVKVFGDDAEHVEIVRKSLDDYIASVNATLSKFGEALPTTSRLIRSCLNFRKGLIGQDELYSVFKLPTFADFAEYPSQEELDQFEEMLASNPDYQELLASEGFEG